MCFPAIFPSPDIDIYFKFLFSIHNLRGNQVNHRYHLAWNSTQRAWMAGGELSRSHKKKKVIFSIVFFLGGINSSSVAETKNITLPGNGVTYFLQSNKGSNGVDSSNGINGSDGSSSYEFTTSTFKPEDNPISITDANIAGGIGGAGTIAMGNGSESGNGGNGGDAVSISTATIFNNGAILTGGNGGDAGGGTGRYLTMGSGGAGGNAISGNHLTINNNTGGVLAGGEAGSGGDVLGIQIASAGGSGGTAIAGKNLSILNDSVISGGNGGSGGTGGVDLNEWGWSGPGDGGEGGSGGAGISGDNLNIVNNGRISGGSGGKGGSGSTTDTSIGGNGGIGGDALVGGNLTIINNGTIDRGAGGNAGNGNGGTNGTSGTGGAAIRLTSNDNYLILKSGSEINGDIVLSETDTFNTLSIASDDATTVTGNLTANAYTSLTLSGKMLTLTGQASFARNTSLTFNNPTWDSVLKADSVSLESTVTLRGNISEWQQNTYTLATTTSGISGFISGNVINELLTEAATDYAKMSLSDDGNSIIYSLRWNNTAGDGYGTFDLKGGAVLNIGTILADNINGADGVWDGKTLTKEGDGTLILTGTNTYTGTTTVSRGTLKTGVEDTFASTSGVTVAEGATLNLSGN
ncbi:autotransporter-associated beta strand repeat-containing protein, partial [Cedecea sp. VD21]